MLSITPRTLLERYYLKEIEQNMILMNYIHLSHLEAGKDKVKINSVRYTVSPHNANTVSR